MKPQPELSDDGAYVSLMTEFSNVTTVNLDGYFTVEDLEKLIEWMKAA